MTRLCTSWRQFAFALVRRGQAGGRRRLACWKCGLNIPSRRGVRDRPSSESASRMVLGPQKGEPRRRETEGRECAHARSKRDERAGCVPNWQLVGVARQECDGPCALGAVWVRAERWRPTTNQTWRSSTFVVSSEIQMRKRDRSLSAQSATVQLLPTGRHRTA